MSLHRPGFSDLFRRQGRLELDTIGSYGGSTCTNTIVNGEVIHTFNTSGDVIVPEPIRVRYVIVSGGGIAPGNVIEGMADLRPGRYVIEVGGPGTPSRFSTIVVGPNESKVPENAPGHGHESTIDGSWKQYAAGSGGTYKTYPSPGSPGRPGIVIIRYSIRDWLTRALNNLRSIAMKTKNNDAAVRKIHAIQSTLSPPPAISTEDWDRVLEVIEPLYTRKLEEMHVFTQRNDAVRAHQRKLDAMMYRMIRKTYLDAKSGNGIPYSDTVLMTLFKIDDDPEHVLDIKDYLRDRTCPELVEGKFVVDGADGTVYMYQMNGLRRIPFDWFRTLEDTTYVMYPEGRLDRCQKLPTSSIIEQRSMKTIEVPDPVDPIFEPAGFAIVHVQSGLALTMSGYDVVARPLSGLDRNQVWQVSGGGFIRSMNNEQRYMTPDPMCQGVITTRDPTQTWNMIRMGDAVIELRHSCGLSVSVDPVSRLVNLSQPSDATQWRLNMLGSADAYDTKKTVEIFSQRTV